MNSFQYANGIYYNPMNVREELPYFDPAKLSHDLVYICFRKAFGDYSTNL